MLKWVHYIYIHTRAYNLGQNIVDKFTKLSIIGLSMECTTADFLQFSSTDVKICYFRGRQSTCCQFQAFQVCS